MHVIQCEYLACMACHERTWREHERTWREHERTWREHERTWREHERTWREHERTWRTVINNVTWYVCAHVMAGNYRVRACELARV
jgi:hypothetical protein